MSLLDHENPESRHPELNRGPTDYESVGSQAQHPTPSRKTSEIRKNWPSSPQRAHNQLGAECSGGRGTRPRWAHGLTDAEFATLTPERRAELVLRELDAANEREGAAQRQRNKIANRIGLRTAVSGKKVVTKGLKVVYFVQALSGLIKIGRTSDLKKRVESLATMSPVPISLVGYIEDIGDAERRLHEELARHRTHGEWFKPHREVVAAIQRELAEATAGPPIEPHEIEGLELEAITRRRDASRAPFPSGRTE